MSLGRVGTEKGPDLDRLRTTLRLAGKRAIFVAGGVSHLGDIVQAAESGARGVLAATALHGGTVTQKEIAALLRERRSQT
jgi:phosphoribosylformimino-5-aminoimidazole carboxamide ribotide isomerase